MLQIMDNKLLKVTCTSKVWLVLGNIVDDWCENVELFKNVEEVDANQEVLQILKRPLGADFSWYFLQENLAADNKMAPRNHWLELEGFFVFL